LEIVARCFVTKRLVIRRASDIIVARVGA
jgi:hypothetical protein